MFYVYILKSKRTAKYYIGQTENLENRLNQHNSGYSLSTKGGIPWELVYYEEYELREEAVQRETALKKKKSRKYIEYIIEVGRASR